MSALRIVGDVLNMSKRTSDMSPLKRTFAKLKHPMRAKVSDSAEEMTDDVDPEAEVPHTTTGEYATSAGHAIIREIAMYLQGDEGEAALKQLFMVQAQVMADIVVQLLLSDELKQASHMAGSEIVTGSSEGIAKKFKAEYGKLPKFVVVSVLGAAAVFGGLFMLGVLLALWRFALFGIP